VSASDSRISLEIDQWLHRLDEGVSHGQPFPGASASPTAKKPVKFGKAASKSKSSGDEPEAKDDPDEEQAELDCMPARR